MYRNSQLKFPDNLAIITLNRPDKRNAISPQMIAELQSALDSIEKSPARIGIITGAGKAFCAGMDLETLSAIATPVPAGKSWTTPAEWPRCSAASGVFPSQ